MTAAKLQGGLVSGDHCTVFTVIPENWSVLLGMLYTVYPAKWMATFRQHLYRSAELLGMQLEGVLFAALHGAYDPATGTYPLHLHGVGTGNYIQALDGLRLLGKYRPAQPHDGRDAAHTPIYMSRDTLTNMPDPLTYILKRHWPQRETYLGSDGLRKAYGGKPKRLPEPAHSEVLQFLDRWRLEDMTLMMGMSVTKNGLVLR